MRTTLDIADDVLQAAKELARREKKTTGEMISELARRSLTRLPGSGAGKKPEPFSGFAPFPSRGGVVTNELIDRIRSQSGTE